MGFWSTPRTVLIAGACVLTATVLGVSSFVLRRGDRPGPGPGPGPGDVVAI